MSRTFSVQLTQLESLYLSDALSMFTQGAPDAPLNNVTPYPNLLLKIGGAVLETDQKRGPVSVELNQYELWMIREVAKSSVVVGNERVGLSLLLKVYTAIQALVAQTDIESVVGTLGEVGESEPGKSQYLDQLERLKKGEVEYDRGGSDDEDGNQRDGGNDKPSNTNKNRPDDDAATAA